jgi:hypothetical protein
MLRADLDRAVKHHSRLIPGLTSRGAGISRGTTRRRRSGRNGH